MFWYQWIFLVSLMVIGPLLAYHLYRLIRSGNPTDYAPRAGDPARAIRYSFTGAMSPAKKESAFMHLPTYTGGLIFHLGTFLSIAILALHISGVPVTGSASIILSLLLLISGASGIAILTKRISRKELRWLSHPDDYIANVLVTLVQLSVSATLFYPPVMPWMYLIASLMVLYIPAGKLKHLLYFFAARYHLGFFYGSRGVWPPLNTRNDPKK